MFKDEIEKSRCSEEMEMKVKVRKEWETDEAQKLVCEMKFRRKVKVKVLKEECS